MVPQPVFRDKAPPATRAKFARLESFRSLVRQLAKIAQSANIQLRMEVVLVLNAVKDMNLTKPKPSAFLAILELTLLELERPAGYAEQKNTVLDKPNRSALHVRRVAQTIKQPKLLVPRQRMRFAAVMQARNPMAHLAKRANPVSTVLVMALCVQTRKDSWAQPSP